MKRKNYKQKLVSCIVIWSVFISSLLLYSPETRVFSASGVPDIKIITPDNEAVFDVSMVEFTGKVVEDGITPDKLSVKVFEMQNNSSKPVEITAEGKLTVASLSDSIEFSFSKEFSEGIHTLLFKAMDDLGSTGELTQTFTVLKAEAATEQVSSAPSEMVTASVSVPAVQETAKRPFMVDMKLIPKGAADAGDYLPAEDMTQVPLDAIIRIVIRDPGQLSTTQPLIVSSSKGEIESLEDINGQAPEKNKNGDYVFTFTPAKPLEASTTYYVYLDPTVSNNSGAAIIPRFFKFTTINTNHLGNIHGNYTNNTNACALCHSTHNGETPTLEGGKYGAGSDNYCMACHDGTNGSPMPDRFNDHNKHSQMKNSDSCTSCHNPHTAWSKENPSRIKSTSVQGAGGNHFQVYSYKKAGSATGNAEDYSLCFSCHNGSKATNIAQYYKDNAFISQSGHNIQAADDSGSSLNGQLPCAECHETHGSNNSKMLRENLGNIKLTAADQFKTTSTTWTASDERTFCLKCHNNSTQLYGKTGIFTDKNAAGEPVSGHQKEDAQACSACHGGASKSAIEAAHAPKK